MEKQAPTLGRLLTMVLFALSCFGLLLFLWLSFGGPTPLKPKGYRFEVAFAEATQLAEQADVRISGVPVGKVVDFREADGKTLATIELRPRYAPLRSDAKAILRAKTLLGETFIELTAGTKRAPWLADGGRLDDDRVASTVELDEVLRALDEETRDDLETFVRGFAKNLDGRAGDLNDVLGNAAPAVREGADLLSILDAERRALATVTRDAGRTFGALGRDAAATQALVVNADRALRTTAARSAELQDVLEVLPTFLRELRPTLATAKATARDAAPVVAALRPTADAIVPALRGTVALTPQVRALLREVDPVLGRARTGLPAATRLVGALPPLLRRLDTTGRELAPVVRYLGQYRQELMQSWMNVAAATQATFRSPGAEQALHYLRVLIPITSEAVVAQPRRFPSNRHNPYPAPRALEKLATGLESFDCSHTTEPCTVQAPPAVEGGGGKQFPRLQADPRKTP